MIDLTQSEVAYALRVICIVDSPLAALSWRLRPDQFVQGQRIRSYRHAWNRGVAPNSRRGVGNKPQAARVAPAAGARCRGRLRLWRPDRSDETLSTGRRRRKHVALSHPGGNVNPYQGAAGCRQRTLVHCHRAGAPRQSFEGTPHHFRYAHAVPGRDGGEPECSAASTLRRCSDRWRHYRLRQQQQDGRSGRELFRPRRRCQLQRGYCYGLSARHRASKRGRFCYR